MPSGGKGRRRIDTVVFDLDGTLVDSVMDVGAILQGLRAERGLPAADDASIRYWSSRGGMQLITATLECEAADAEGLLQEFRARYHARPTNPVSLYHGVRDALAALSEAGVRLAVCTNKPARLAEKVLEELRLRHHFGTLVCGDTFARKKPDPMPLLEAIRLCGGMPARALLVGDSTVDQRTAAAAGVRFCFFEGGYDDGVVPDPAGASVGRIADLVPLILEDAVPVSAVHTGPGSSRN